ncbi:hypothetical protein PVAND_008323 [Polypedilum vanderplanki]|uniref:Uncharacterized protein n=1 Tax=Polypedilum vanderplanki TaxID=319348 RepID=A0A9J6C9M7_POLVA|nr:hypothetical protein PVAND_008323 [Polypedilum vanderplanki]
MWKLAVFLVITALCVVVHADEEQTKTDSQPSMIETMLCYVAPKPLTCLKEQTGRMLNYWEAKVEEKRQKLMVQADEEMKENESSRNLSDDEKKERPSELMTSLEKGFSALANIVSDEVNNFRGRNGRALDKTEEKQIDNDFNNDDDFSLYDLAKTEEGNVTQNDDDGEEGRAKTLKGYKGKKKQSFGYEEEGGNFYGYSGFGKGKKGKKGKKGLMKMFFLGAILKSKIEMLLKILSFHLQLKFFAIALINMVINLARFWIDLKKHPQKHHYDEHDDWGNSWKRNTNQQEQYQGDFAHRLAYSNNGGYPSHTQQY